jgi:hypothetical protein
MLTIAAIVRNAASSKASNFKKPDKVSMLHAAKILPGEYSGCGVFAVATVGRFALMTVGVSIGWPQFVQNVNSSATTALQSEQIICLSASS